MDEKFEAHAGGALIVDGQEVASTLRCVHHGGHFVSKRGSGIRRGFCMKCMGPTCGEPACDLCVPLEVQLEVMEGRRKWPGQ
jgi:hypothetical protein